MVISTGLFTFLVAEMLKPGSSPRNRAVVRIVVAVPLTMITVSQKSDLLELPLCSQVNVISPPTGTAYPPGIRVPLAEKLATNTKIRKGTVR